MLFDSGEDILLLGAFRKPIPYLIRDRDAFHGMLRSTAGLKDNETEVTLPEREASVLELLTREATLRKKDQSDPKPVDTSGRLFLNEACVEIEAGDDLQAQTQHLVRLLGSGPAVEEGGWSAVVRFVGDEPFEQLRTIETIVRTVTPHVSGMRGDRLAWEISSPFSTLPDAALEVLPKMPRVVPVLEDRTEVEPPRCAREEQWARVEALADRGLACPVSLVTLGEPGLAQRAEDWTRRNDGAGVRIALPWDLGLSVERWVLTEERLGVLLEELGRIAESLAGSMSLVVSEPWKSILRTALHGSLLTNWERKARSTVFMTSNAFWARTRAHAALGLLGPSPELNVGASDGLRWLQPGRQELTDGPHCVGCEYAYICDRYWSPALDVLLRQGREVEARNLADFECALRKRTLEVFLRSMRDELRARDEQEPPAGNRMAKASYEEGVLRVELVADE